MRTWNSPVVNLAHFLGFAVNLTTGLFNIWHHRNGLAMVNMACAGAMIGMNVAYGLRRRTLQRTLQRARLAAMGQYYLGAARSKGVTDQEILEAWLMAVRNLERVAKNTGATIISNAKAEIIIDGYKYTVVPHGIERNPAPPRIGYGSSTCLRQHQAPYPELVAATLLLLKNDPTIFDRWAAQDGWYA